MIFTYKKRDRFLLFLKSSLSPFHVAGYFYGKVACPLFMKLPRFARNDFKLKKTRQRPTLPLCPQSSTIGTKELNFRVRNGNGYFLFVMVAGKLSPKIKRGCSSKGHSLIYRKGCPRWERPLYFSSGQILLFFVLINFMVKPHGLLVLVSSIRYRTYTPSLSTL